METYDLLNKYVCAEIEFLARAIVLDLMILFDIITDFLFPIIIATIFSIQMCERKHNGFNIEDE